MRRQLIVNGVFFGLFALGLLGGGVYILVVQQSGERAEATVTECHRRVRSDVCTGSWVEGGDLGSGGQVASGTIEGADSDDVGETLDVRLSGGRAYTTSLRLPLILLGCGLAVVVLGAISLRATARRAARLADASPPLPTAAPTGPALPGPPPPGWQPPVTPSG